MIGNLIRPLSGLALAVVLSGCGVVAHNRAAGRVDDSLAAYKACLAEHPSNVEPCKGAKAAYDADVRAYQVRYGTASAITVKTE